MGRILNNYLVVFIFVQHCQICFLKMKRLALKLFALSYYLATLRLLHFFTITKVELLTVKSKTSYKS